MDDITTNTTPLQVEAPSSHDVFASDAIRTDSNTSVQQRMQPEDTIGFCLECGRLVRRDERAQCVNGHPLQAVMGAQVVAPDVEPPELPRFNWAAFFMPPIWGAAHGIYFAGLVVIPLWLFLDSAIQAAVYKVGAGTPLLSRIIVYTVTVLLIAGTLGLMTWFGRTAWGVAWRREYVDGTSTRPFDEFVKREKRWYWLCMPLFFLLLGGAIAYWKYYLPPII